MRYFDEALVNAHPRQHGAWWQELTAEREYFHRKEDELAEVQNAAAVLPRDAWMDLDTVTRRVMRTDEGAVWMNDLMPLAKPVNIGKLVHLSRVSSDISDQVVVSISGQVPVPLDKSTYDYRGTPVPIFQKGYGREWREWNTLQSENFDALADDQEATVAQVRRRNSLYVLDGDPRINIGGYSAYGIRTSPLSKSINLGAAGANIDLTDPTVPFATIDAFFTGAFGAIMDDNLVAAPVNLYVSPHIARNWDRRAEEGVEGTILSRILGNRRIAKVAVSFELQGNEFFGFVPSAEYIRPLVAMATSTFAMPRNYPTANYQFEVWNAMGIEIRGDFNGRSGVFYSVEA